MSQIDDGLTSLTVRSGGGVQEPALPWQDPRVLRALEEYRAALEAGQPPDRQEFQARYPEIGEALAGCLAALEFVHLVAPELSQPDVGREQDYSSVSPGIRHATPLGDFRLVREVGRGGMGVVYEAEQLSLGRRVALKVLPFASTMDARQLQRFKNEAHAAAQLHHPNIVPVYATGCERGVHFHAMQFIDGQTVAGLIEDLRGNMKREAPSAERGKQGPDPAGVPEPLPAAAIASQLDLPAETSEIHAGMESTVRSALHAPRSTPFFRTVAHLGVQTAAALEHAHSLGVVHRDIKPANLLVETSSPLAPLGPGAGGEGLRLWVTDFGLAHCQSQAGLTMTGDLLGTLRYMSPEQALARRDLVDQRTDIYSLGVTLYELLTLEPPFAGSDQQELLRQIAFEEPLPPRRWNKAIPAELETVVLKAMEKNSADRYGTAEELAEDLRRFLEDRPIRARRPTLLHKLRKWSRRNRAVVGTLLGSLVVLLASLAALFVWRIQERRQQAEDRAAEAQQALERLSQANHLVQSGWFHAGGGQWAKAHDAFNRAVALRPDNSLVWLERGDFYTRLGLWDRAAKDYVKGFALQRPPLPHLWLGHAALSLSERDTEGYRRLCAQMPKHFNPQADYFGQESTIVRAYTLASFPGADWGWALAMGKAMVDRRGNQPWDHTALAMACYRAGQYAEAAQRLRKSLETDPKWLDGCMNYTLLAMTYHRLGRRPEAREALKAAGRWIDNGTYQVCTSGSFVPRTGWHNWLECLVLYREANTLIDGSAPPWDARLQAVRSRALGALGRAQEAAACYDEANQMSPHDVVVRLAGLSPPKDLGQYAKALAQLRRLLERYPKQQAESPRALGQKYCELGRLLTSKNRIQEAAEALDQAIELAPNEWRAWRERSLIFEKLGQWDKAAAHWSKAIDRNPKDVAGWAYRGFVFGHLRKHAKAIDDYSKAIALDPKNASLYNCRAGAYAALGKYPPAIADCSKGIALNSRDAGGYAIQGDAYWHLGKHAQAVIDCSKALALDPKNYTALHYRGNAYQSLGQYDKAIGDYSKTIELDPRDAGARFCRGQAYYSLGQHGKALADYSKAIQLDPIHASVHNGLAWMLATCPDPKFRDPRGAVALAKKAVELAPKDGNNWNTLGTARYRAAKWKAAIEALKQSMKLRSGGNSFDWFFLAMAHWRLDKREKARQWYDRAVHWMEKNQPQDEELCRFRTEAAQLLGIERPPVRQKKTLPPSRPGVRTRPRHELPHLVAERSRA
jgi:tetratricopeptide (TPR) repeat protein